MASRFYPITGTPAISPAVTSGWEVTGPSFARILMDRSPINYTSTSSSSAGSGVANQDTIDLQMIIGPVMAQTIAGNVKGQIAAREGNANCDARIQGTIRVIAPDGTTVRGTLLNFNTAGLSNEFNVHASTFRNVKFPLNGSAALTSTDALTGDYIVIDCGFRNHGTNTSGVRVSHPAGDQSNGDLPEDETTAPPTNYRGWMEFSQDLLLLVPRTAAMHDLGAVMG